MEFYSPLDPGENGTAAILQMQLPEIRTQLPVLVNPDLPNAERITAKWARKFLRFAFSSDEYLDLYIQTQAGLWGSYAAPLVSPEIHRLAVDWSTGLFAIDDIIMADGSTLEALAMRTEKVTESSGLEGGETDLDLVFDDLWARTKSVASPSNAEQSKRLFLAYIEAVRQENIYRQSGDTPTPERMLEIRCESIGIRFFLTLVEAGLGFCLGEDDRSSIDPTVTFALEHVALVNDLFSYRKEYFEEDKFNMIDSLIFHEKLSTQEAIDRACTLISEKEDEFIRTGEEMRLRGAIFDDYLRAVGYLMSGNLHWSRISPRYNGTAFHWNGVSSGRMLWQPESTSYLPES